MIDFAPTVLLPVLRLCILPFTTKEARKRERRKGSRRRHHMQRDE